MPSNSVMALFGIEIILACFEVPSRNLRGETEKIMVLCVQAAIRGGRLPNVSVT